MANIPLRGSIANVLKTQKRYASNLKVTQKSDPKLWMQHEGIKVTKLPNGIVVASLENYSPISRISVVVNASSRHETYDQQGVSHALRVFSNLSTKNYTTYGLTRTLDHLGANFSVTNTREQTSFNLISTRDNISKASAVVADVVNSLTFKPWEVNDSLERLKIEIELYNKSPEIKIGELLHKVAFRKELSQSLYCSEALIHNINSETLQQFKEKNYSLDKVSLVGVGVKHEFLIRFAEKLHLASSSNKSEASKYLGGELRDETTSETVHIAVASEGASLPSKDLLASGIVNHAFGTGPRIKWNDGGSKISRCLAVGSKPAMISSFNLNYTDSGLFGFHVITHRDDSGKIVKNLFKECLKTTKSGFSAEEIAIAKNNLKASLSMSLECSQKLIESIGLSPENSNSNLKELYKAIDAVPANDVNSFAKKLMSGKVSLAATGDLRNLPRTEELYS